MTQVADIKKWYVVYTKPRWEKKVHGLLNERGFENYCPLNRVRKIWSDRIKAIEEPLFKSYVFVKIDESEQTKIRMVKGVLNFVYWVGKPAIVKANEIEAIKRFLNEHENVNAETLSLEQNMKVRVLQGAFMDKEGTVLKVINNKVYLAIESIGYALSASVNKSNVVIVGK